MKPLTALFSLVALTLLWSGQADAAPITYTLDNSTIPHTSPSITYPFTLEEDGVTLTGTQSAVTPVNSVFATGVDFFPQANAYNLTLQFSQDVTITSVSFGEVSGVMTFTVNGGTPFDAVAGTNELPEAIDIAADTPFIIFGTGAASGTTYAELNGVTVVPEPATGSLMLGAMLLASRRRQA